MLGLGHGKPLSRTQDPGECSQDPGNWWGIGKEQKLRGSEIGMAENACPLPKVSILVSMGINLAFEKF